MQVPPVKDQISSADMAAYMRSWRSRRQVLRRVLKNRPVANFRPLPLEEQRPGHCIFCGDRTVAVDQVCSRCRGEVEA